MERVKGEGRMYDRLSYQTSAELCEQMAAECDTIVLAFSTGKDSIAAWLQARKYFRRVVPYYAYCVPGLSFVERSLDYYEEFFGTHIVRVPHKAFFDWLNCNIYQPPERKRAITELQLPGDEYNNLTIGDMIRLYGELPEAAYTAVGVRAADSPQRRLAISRYGAINHSKKLFYPVYDWKKADVLAAIDEAGVKLPVDYKLFGRTFDGIDYRFLKPIKEHFPEDYERILELFPLADLELFRRGEL